MGKGYTSAQRGEDRPSIRSWRRHFGLLSAGLSLGVCAGCESQWSEAPSESSPPHVLRSELPTTIVSSEVMSSKTGLSPKQAGPASTEEPTAKDSPVKSSVVRTSTTDAQTNEKEPAVPADAKDQPTKAVTASAKKEPLSIDLATALRLANVGNPTINLAREREREAYFHLSEAEVAWLPNLQTGPAYYRHDGQTQNSRGQVFGVSKSNFFEGGGAILTWDSSTILFGPLIAQRLAEAQSAASRAVTSDVQLEVALAYLDLVRVHAALAINANTMARAEEMMRSAEAGEKAGKGKTPADLPRAQAEVEARKEERIELQGLAGVASARVARLLLLEPTVDLRPAEPAVVPISLVSVDLPIEQLVDMGLLNRPELAERRALVGAAQARYRQARLDPLIPKLQVSYFAGTFGGGVNDDLSNFSGRGDGLAQAVWELHNLGAGDVARTRVRRSQFNQANTQVVEVQSQVAEDVTAAAKVVQARQEALDSAQKAIKYSLETWRRLSEASFGLGGRDQRFDPLEALLAEQALDQARLRYLKQVIEYNQAQFRLYWAMGQPPIEALPEAVAHPVDVPVVPGKYRPPEKPAKP
jgi:outer membrane protein TolC